MKKVLIVSYYFPPLNIIASKRYGTMCKYFEAYGYKPIVLTTCQSGSSGLDARRDLEVPISREQIIKIGKNSKNSSNQVVFDNFLIDLMDKYKFSSRTVDAVSLDWFRRVKENINIKKLQDIDIIIGTFPPMGNLFVAYYLARKLDCPYIVDIRDLISDYVDTFSEYKSLKRTDRLIEGFFLRHAAGIVTVTPGFKKVYQSRLPTKCYGVVFNGLEKSEKEQVCYNCNNEEKYLYYAGSLYAHRLEGFEILVRCLKRINHETDNNIKMIFRSMGPKKLDIKAKQIVQLEGMQKYISILPATSENIVKAEYEKSHINIVLSIIHNDDLAAMVSIPGKVYELLNEKAPILAVVPKNCDVEKILRYTHKGIATTAEDEIIDFILNGYKKYKGNNKVFDFTREKQAERLCRFMDRVLEDTHEKNHACFWDKA